MKRKVTCYDSFKVGVRGNIIFSFNYPNPINGFNLRRPLTTCLLSHWRMGQNALQGIFHSSPSPNPSTKSICFLNWEKKKNRTFLKFFNLVNVVYKFMVTMLLTYNLIKDNINIYIYIYKIQIWYLYKRNYSWVVNKSTEQAKGHAIFRWWGTLRRHIHKNLTSELYCVHLERG